MVFELVKEKDEEILQHVRHIETERSTSPKALTVKFHFNENEFFDNKELSLKVVYKGDNDMVEKIEGTTIDWKEGKDPTKKKVKKKQKHKKTNETRTIVKTVEAESFFNVFNNRVAPEEGAVDSEEENELHDKIDEAMNLAEDIADVLIPDALEYYLGLNEDFDDADMMDDEDDDDEDDDDDHEDKGDKKKGGKKGGDKAAGAQGGKEGQQECKQQ
jgi:nucleosome assembly protein 1-like 1